MRRKPSFCLQGLGDDREEQEPEPVMIACDYLAPRTCLREPIPEIFRAAELLRSAMHAHQAGDHQRSIDLIARTDMPEVAAWQASIWGKGNGPVVRERPVANPLPYPPRDQLAALREPASATKRALIARDGRHCRFCGIPLIRAEVRDRILKRYAGAIRWGRKDADKHAAFQCLWLQYDHVVPYARGEDSTLENMIITCAACNYGRMDLALDEVGLIDPRARPPVLSDWDGLEPFAL
jgi:5-methylcytosine-specific restriction endonuclease McrA